jgi:hypothetical protein
MGWETMKIILGKGKYDLGVKGLTLVTYNIYANAWVKVLK